MDLIEGEPIVEVGRIQLVGMVGPKFALRIGDTDLEETEHNIIEGEIMNVMAQPCDTSILFLQPQLEFDMYLPVPTSIVRLLVETHETHGQGIKLLDAWPTDLDNAPLVSIV